MNYCANIFPKQWIEIDLVKFALLLDIRNSLQAMQWLEKYYGDVCLSKSTMKSWFW